MIPNGILRNIPIIVVREKIRPLKGKFPVTSFTNIEKIDEVIPQPKVYMKNAVETGTKMLLKLLACLKSLNSLNIQICNDLRSEGLFIDSYP